MNVAKGYKKQLQLCYFLSFNQLKAFAYTQILYLSTTAETKERNTVCSPNDYGRVALTVLVMKCFERLVLHHLKASLRALTNISFLQGK